MKSEERIKEELKKQYQHRLALRIERKMKCCCRNCANHTEQEFNLGELGTHTHYNCKIDSVHFQEKCPKFIPLYSREAIEQELFNDIKDPAVCGAKEPKIAALLWVLHEDAKEPDTILGKIFNFFSK